MTVSTIALRCIVCGREFDVPVSVAERAARQITDGTFSEVDPDEAWVRARFPDGLIAGSCTGHTADEVRAAYVLTEWKLTEETTE